jgi:hypothetical protein
VHNHAQVATAKAVFWQVSFKDDGVEFVDGHGTLAGVRSTHGGLMLAFPERVARTQESPGLAATGRRGG